MFTSKLTGKKKLYVDSRILYQDQEHKNNFNYSFQIDSTHFNIVQLTEEEFDLRIDNRSFLIWYQEEKSVKLAESKEIQQLKEDYYPRKEEKKFKQLPSYLRSKGTKDTDSNHSKEEMNFYEIQNQIRPTKTTEVKQNNRNNNTIQLLNLELTDAPPYSAKNNSQGIKTVQTYTQNQNILNNMNFFDKDKKTYLPKPQNTHYYDNNSQVNYGNEIKQARNVLLNNNLPHTNNPLESNQNGNIDLVYSTNVNMNMNQGTINPSPYNNYPYNQQHQQHQPHFQPQPQPQLRPQQGYQQQQNQQFYQQNQPMDHQIKLQQPLQQQPLQQYQQPQQYVNNNQREYQKDIEPIMMKQEELIAPPQPFLQYQNNSNSNELKTRIITSGLVNIDNLLKDYKPSGFPNGDKYNFDNALKGTQDYYTQNSNLNDNQDYDFNSQLQPNSYEINQSSKNANYQDRSQFDY